MSHSPAIARWYLVQCKPRQENRAVENLRNQLIPCYCPQHTVEKVRHGKRAVTQQPLFSGYIFIHLCKLNDNWHSIRSTRGVQRLVTFANEPLAVPDDIIDALQARLALTEKQPLFNEGAPVTITDGPFKDLDAIFCKADGEERALILLNLLHRQQHIKVPLNTLKALG